MKAYIVDVDGTIADASKRLHFIQDKSNPRWDEFFEACDQDEPITDVIEVIQALHMRGILKDDTRIFYLTGRPERIRRKTEWWLLDHGLPNGQMLMRQDRDHRPDTETKREGMQAIIEAGYQIVGVFEDRPRVCEVWLEMGLTVFQVGNWREFDVK